MLASSYQFPSSVSDGVTEDQLRGPVLLQPGASSFQPLLQPRSHSSQPQTQLPASRPAPAAATKVTRHHKSTANTPEAKHETPQFAEKLSVKRLERPEAAFIVFQGCTEQSDTCTD